MEPVAKAANYEYGAVNNDATPVLATFLLLSIAIAALVREFYCMHMSTPTISKVDNLGNVFYPIQVPYILSIGEGAAAQQRGREDENFIGDNQFAKRARLERAKKEARKGSK